MKRLDYSKKIKLPVVKKLVSGYDAGDSGNTVSRYWLTKVYPNLTYEENLELMKHHYKMAKKFKKQYNNAVNAAFKTHLGRKPHVLDYKVSCVWRDEFPSATKDKMRDADKKYSKAFYLYLLHNSKVVKKDQYTDRP